MPYLFLEEHEVEPLRKAVRIGVTSLGFKELVVADLSSAEQQIAEYRHVLAAQAKLSKLATQEAEHE